MTVVRLATRVERLEQQRAHAPDRLSWDDLPPLDEIGPEHLARLASRFTHEQALDILDAMEAAAATDNGGDAA